MLRDCRYGAERLNCTDMCTYSWATLTGRCVVIRALYQSDPDYHGAVTVTVRQLPSWLLESGGKQRQMVGFMKSFGSEAYTFPRHFFTFPSSNRLKMKFRKVKLLASNPNCDAFTFSDIAIGAEISNCYHVNWVRLRLWEPHSCTHFHEWRNASRYAVCDPAIIVRDYANVVNPTVIGGGKCLPACNREFREVVQDSRIRDGTSADDEMTISIHYGDLEYENVEETDFFVWLSTYFIKVCKKVI